MLKLLLFLNNKPIPHHHSLAKLYDDEEDGLPAKCQQQLEKTYQASRSILPAGYELIALINTDSPLRVPEAPPNRDIWTLRGIFEYFDEDVMLWKKRYSWELVEKGGYRHYISDISVFVELINRVMRDIRRE